MVLPIGRNGTLTRISNWTTDDQFSHRPFLLFLDRHEQILVTKIDRSKRCNYFNLYCCVFYISVVLCLWFDARIMPNGFRYRKKCSHFTNQWKWDQEKDGSKTTRKRRRRRRHTISKHIQLKCFLYFDAFFPSLRSDFSGWITYFFFHCGSMPNLLMGFLTLCECSKKLSAQIPCLPHRDIGSLGWPAVYSNAVREDRMREKKE